MNFSELPESIRVKLSKEGTDELWHRIEEFGGVKQMSESFGYSSSKMYNWKSKNSFVPVDIVKKVFGNEASDEIIAVKGGGRSKSIQNPEFPLRENDELLTRIDLSVSINSNGTPIYQTDDRGNVERFIELLQTVGEVPYSIYSRELYELRYPKFLHQLFEKMSFDKHLTALIDEKAEVHENRIVLPDRVIEIPDFDGELYHRDKKLQLALARNDNETVREMMSEEAERVREALE